MNIAYYKEYSRQLGRNMEFKRYGWGGKICVVFPCLNGRFYDYEDFRMPEALPHFLTAENCSCFVWMARCRNLDCPGRSAPADGTA